jgi:HlyD family secretion protein
MQRLSGPLALILGLAASISAFLWLRREPAPAPAGPGRPPFVLPVTVGPVERGVLRPAVELVGDVRAARRARLAFETEGWVREVAAADGDAVPMGQVLARLHDATQRAGLEEARAALVEAERRLARLAAGEREEVVERLRAEQAVAGADLQLAELEVARGAELLRERVVSQSAQDRNVAARDAAAGRLASARQRLAEAEAGARAEDLAIAEAEVSAARARVASAEQALAQTVLTAPWDGVVVERLLDEGDFAPRGSAVFDLVDLELLEVVLEVPGGVAEGLVAGVAVELRVDERPGAVLAADLDVLVPVADPASRNFRALIRVDRDDPARELLRPGQFVRARVQRAPLEGVLLVPQDAVRLTDAGAVVVVAEPIPGAEPPSGPPTGPPAPWLQAAWVPVRALATADGVTAVEPIQGVLEAGATVVLTGVDRAFPGVALMPALQAPERPAASPDAAAGDAAR